jgi:hypothetical protein
VDCAVDNSRRLWLPQEGDEVRLSEPERFAGFYATVIECNGIEALVEFPDRARAIVPSPSLVLVLRPAPGPGRTAEQIVREAFDP